MQRLSSGDMEKKMISVTGQNKPAISMQCVTMYIFTIAEPNHLYPKKKKN